MPTRPTPGREHHPIRTYRERWGLSMTEIADRVGISLAALSRIESGFVEMPSAIIVAKLARATGAEVSEFDIFRYHLAAATGCVAPLRAPMTADFSWTWIPENQITLLGG